MPAAERVGAPDANPVALAAAARLLRLKGVQAVTPAELAAAAKLEEGRLPSKQRLLVAIGSETLERLKATDAQPWSGYGSGMRRALSAVRSFPDGFILLMRWGPTEPALNGAYEALRQRTARRLRALLWFPDRPPPPAERPQHLQLALEPMVSYCNDALLYWTEQGAPQQDDLFLSWHGRTMREWRHNAARLLNLDTPEQDWPFESDPAGRFNSVV